MTVRGTPSDIAIRPATPADAPALGALAGQLVRQHHAMDPQRFMIWEPVEPGYGRFLGGAQKDARSVVLVAVEPLAADDPAAEPGRPRERVIGYAYGRMEPRDWYALRDACGVLHDILVDPGWQRRGVATRLATAMIARLEAMGAPRVVLMTAAPNHGAQALFARLGFRPTMQEMTRESTAAVSPVASAPEPADDHPSRSK